VGKKNLSLRLYQGGGASHPLKKEENDIHKNISRKKERKVQLNSRKKGGKGDGERRINVGKGFK